MTTLHTVAGYLPGLTAGEVQFQTLVFQSAGNRLEVAVPVLTPEQMGQVAQRVREASRLHLKAMTVSQIVLVIDAAVARLLDPGDPYRQQCDRLLPIVSGYDPEMVRLGLTSFFKTFRAPQLQRFVAEDFANPKLLDEFQPRPKGGLAKAFGPELLVHSWAGNVPALALWSLVCGLLVKSGSVGKLASAEPVFAGLFARLLAEVHPPLADCLAVVWWKGGDAAQAEALFAEADTVLAYGGNDALDAIRRQLPVTTRFLPFGHKLGFGMVGREALDTLRAPATARLAALDVTRYDQQGCYSPHVFYVERGGAVSPREFAQHLSAELANLEHRFPRRPLALEDTAAVAGWRQQHELKSLASSPQSSPTSSLAASLASDTGGLIGEPGASWGLAYSEQPRPLSPSALNRSIEVVAVDALDDVVPLLSASRAYLQTAGLAVAPERLSHLAELLGAAGVTRIAALGAMTSPEAGWHHDGRFNLLDLVRLVEIEQSAELAAERFALYAD